MTGMSEVDTEPLVVWPSWCYAGERGMTTVEGVKAERLSPESPGSSRSPASSATPPPRPETASRPDLARNYSDLMRTLAAKYNNNHPNDYFSRTNGVKATKEENGPAAGLAGLVGPLGPMFPPILEPALLSMVRSGAQANLENYLKGAMKRPMESPLDLSLSAPSTPVPLAPPTKRLKKPSLSESLYGPDVIPLLRQSRKPGSPRPKKLPLGPLVVPSRPPSRCGSTCSGERPCVPDSQAIALWSVEDVATFVSSVDMCSEYAPNFREQKIDGSSLSLLTEEHLTAALGMKLGPALKLRTALAGRLGQCALCRHCVHCHRAPSPPPPPSQHTS